MTQLTITKRQALANANYQALLKERNELGHKIAVALAASEIILRQPAPEYVALQKQYNAVAVHLEEAEEECRQANVAASNSQPD